MTSQRPVTLGNILGVRAGPDQVDLMVALGDG